MPYAQPINIGKMAVVGDNNCSPLNGLGGNPYVVDGNRKAFPSQGILDHSKAFASFTGDLQGNRMKIRSIAELRLQDF